LKDGEVGFMYFDVLGTKPRPGVVTVAYQYACAGYMRMGVSFCSPKEKHFSKKIGRTLAFNRMDIVISSAIDGIIFTQKVIREVALAFIVGESKKSNIGWMQKKGVRIEVHNKGQKIRQAIAKYGVTIPLSKSVAELFKKRSTKEYSNMDSEM
jgi:hypothetical protein